MNLSNKPISLWLNILYFFYILILGVSIVGIVVKGSMSNYFEPWVVFSVVGIIFLLSVYLGRQIVSYNSEYDVIEIKSSYSLLSVFNLSPRNIVEFPKRKLHNHRFKKGLLKTQLVIELNSKDGIRKQYVNVTFLGKKKRKEIAKDLDNIKEELKNGLHLAGEL